MPDVLRARRDLSAAQFQASEYAMIGERFGAGGLAVLSSHADHIANDQPLISETHRRTA